MTLDKPAPDEHDNQSMVTTLADVARRAGVGESTVSRVLRNKGSVSQSTREKILKVAADLNYVPNRIAGNLGFDDVQAGRGSSFPRSATRWCRRFLPAPIRCWKMPASSR